MLCCYVRHPHIKSAQWREASRPSQEERQVSPIENISQKSSINKGDALLIWHTQASSLKSAEEVRKREKTNSWVVDDYLWVLYCWRVSSFGSRVYLELVYVMTLISGCYCILNWYVWIRRRLLGFLPYGFPGQIFVSLYVSVHGYSLSDPYLLLKLKEMKIIS